MTLTNVGNTIQGAGIIGNNGLSLVNGVGGTLLANAPGQTLSITGVGTLTNNGTMQVNDLSTMTVSSGSGSMTNTGNVNVNNGGTFALQSTNYNQTGGNTRVDGAFGGSGVQVNINGGTRRGNGSTPFGTNGTITGAVRGSRTARKKLRKWGSLNPCLHELPSPECCDVP